MITLINFDSFSEDVVMQAFAAAGIAVEKCQLGPGIQLLDLTLATAAPTDAPVDDTDGKNISTEIEVDLSPLETVAAEPEMPTVELPDEQTDFAPPQPEKTLAVGTIRIYSLDSQQIVTVRSDIDSETSYLNVSSVVEGESHVNFDFGGRHFNFPYGDFRNTSINQQFSTAEPIERAISITTSQAIPFGQEPITTSFNIIKVYLKEDVSMPEGLYIGKDFYIPVIVPLYDKVSEE